MVCFDYEPTDEQLCVSSKDGDALQQLMEAFGKICNNAALLEHLMQEIDYK